MIPEHLQAKGHFQKNQSQVPLYRNQQLHFISSLKSNFYTEVFYNFGNQNIERVIEFRRKLLDELKKDGDGMYKLKFNSISINKEASDFIRYDKIEIVYKENSKETVLLTGKFN